MKVLQVNSHCGVGSTGRIMTDIDQMLKSQGDNSYLAYGRDYPNNNGTPIRIGSKLNNYTHAIKTRILDLHGFGSKKPTFDFIEKVKSIDPDIIHLHNIHGYYLNIEILFDYLKQINKPIIWTLHDCWPFTGHCAYFDYVSCDKWMTGCNSCPQKSSYPSSSLLDNSKYNYQKKKELFNGVKNMTIITPSEWLAKTVKRSFLKDYPVQVINNGIDLNVFKPTTSSFREERGLGNKFILLGVANDWDKRKGLEYFLEMSSDLKSDEVIVLIGLNDKQMRELPNNILGISRTNSPNELAQIYSTSDVFVNPTLEDNFPTTNLESLACGTPIITFDTGGSVESVDNACGFVVSKGSSKEILEKKDIIKENGKDFYFTNCINKSITNYNKQGMFTQYIDLYNKLLQK